MCAASDAFVAWFGREPASAADCAWMNGYAAALLARVAPEPSADAVGCHAFCSSDRHLSGWRVTIGFDTLEQAQAAHQFIANAGKALAARLSATKPAETEPCSCTNNKYGEFDGDCKLCGGTGRLPSTKAERHE